MSNNTAATLEAAPAEAPKKGKKRKEKESDISASTPEKKIAAEEEQVKKVKKKKKEQVELSDAPVKGPNEDVVKLSKESSEKTNTEGISDPGWDYTATSITRPAWRTAAIWSDDEDDEPVEEKSM